MTASEKQLEIESRWTQLNNRLSKFEKVLEVYCKENKIIADQNYYCQEIKQKLIPQYFGESADINSNDLPPVKIKLFSLPDATIELCKLHNLEVPE